MTADNIWAIAHSDWYHSLRRDQMKLKWLGHSCFQITSDNGIRVVTDPFDESVGYPVPDAEADIVTMSHEHHDHSNSKCVHGEFVIFTQPGKYTEKGIQDHRRGNRP